MLYVIYAEDIADSLKSACRYVPPTARLQLLQDEGRLLTAGPIPAVDSNEHGAAGFYWLNGHCGVRIAGSRQSMGK